MTRWARRLLLIYFIISAPLALICLYTYRGQLRAFFAEAHESRTYRAQHEAVRGPWDFDSGTIGGFGESAHFDWTAAESVSGSQTRLRAMFETALGRRLRYRENATIEARQSEVIEGGITRIVSTVAAEPGFEIKVCLLVPPGPGPHPAVVVAYGLGGSIFETSGYGFESYHNDMALGLAKAGYVTAAYEIRGLGRHANDWGDASWGAMHYPDFVGYTLTNGSCAMNVWVYDGLQVVGALARHESVDPERVAFAGISHGGQIAMYAAALDPERIKVAVAMGSFLSYEDLYTSIHNLTGHAIPGIREFADMGDVAGLVAPRPMLVQWGELERDTYHGSLNANSLSEFERTRAIYAEFGAEDALSSRITAGEGHAFDVDAAVEFLARHL